MPPSKIMIHRAISWLLALVSIGTIGTGYSLSRGWISQIYLISALHRVFEVFFIALLALHVGITLWHFSINRKRLLQRIMAGRGLKVNLLRLVQRVSSWMIIAFAFLVITSGLLGYEFFAVYLDGIIPFNWHRVYDFGLVVTIIIHVAVGLKFFTIRKRIRKRMANSVIFTTTIGLLLVVSFLQFQPGLSPPIQTTNPGDDDPTATVPIEPIGDAVGSATIGDTSYQFNSSNVVTRRPDIFKEGAFSMFDVLVHIADLGHIQLAYHFNATMNTFVIDTINGELFWWYRTWYSGGWPERNVFRMDHYHWKPLTRLEFYQASESRITQIYSSFVEENERLQSNTGNLIIPHVRIAGRNNVWTFEDVNVTAHDLRSDIFQPDVITGIDVIMSLGDQNLITYEISWYDSIGTAHLVRNYFVTAINGDQAVGTCGFVYESGDTDFKTNGNHIHLPSDSRVMNSPEYAEWYWICL
ncbi:cytochrome b/b6 domain-containing protein [Candidatus Thorarchaeota archaeon]|nr:MAG: cytochrome b/b6 domain-containing protein [Candidatus Thorarchaeota archaeon]